MQSPYIKKTKTLPPDRPVKFEIIDLLKMRQTGIGICLRSLRSTVLMSRECIFLFAVVIKLLTTLFVNAAYH